MRIFTLNSKLRVDEYQLLKWLVVYRWLAILLPTVNLFVLGSPANKGLGGALYGLAWVNLFLQTWIGLSFQRKLKKGFATPDKVYIVTLIIFELLVCSALNNAGGVWASPYYLYSLAAIFQSAFFYGMLGAWASTSVLSASYLAGMSASLILGGKSGSWLVPVFELSGFFICGVLAGYLVLALRQVRRQTGFLGRYRESLEYQSQSLERSNRRLDYLAHFSRVLQEGNTAGRVEQLAVQYLGRFLENVRGKAYSANQTQQVQLVKGEAMQEWLNDAPAATQSGRQSQPGSEIATVWKNQQRYWVMPLRYKGEQYGALIVPVAPGAYETEEKLLLSLLGDQMVRVLGSLKQSQALAVEAERARLAMDMHDVVAQSLFGIALNLNACVKLLDKQQLHESRQRLADLQALAFDTLGSVRSIIYDLWNEETGKTDFATLVQAYLKKAGRLYPFEIVLEIKDRGYKSAFELGQETQKSLYRVLQESLANAAKHANASEVWITLARSESQVEMEVRDNGRGFNFNGLQFINKKGLQPQTGSGGMGLTNMRERLEQLGGKLIVESLPGKGTRLLATIPVQIAKVERMEAEIS